MPTAHLIDNLLAELDNGLRTLAAPAQPARPSPATGLPRPSLSEDERASGASLMRVNHAGEVAAQALYRGQAFTTRDPALRQNLLDAAREEQDHLAWCAQRVNELGSHTSLLGPLWYAGSFILGATAGLLGRADGTRLRGGDRAPGRGTPVGTPGPTPAGGPAQPRDRSADAGLTRSPTGPTPANWAARTCRNPCGRACGRWPGS